MDAAVRERLEDKDQDRPWQRKPRDKQVLCFAAIFPTRLEI